MTIKDSRVEIIDRLVDYITHKLPQHEAPLVETFVRQYYLSVSPEDLASHSILDLYGAVVSHWHYLYERKPFEPKVRVFNPELETDGWQSKHTVIEISFDDMPFLVDSIIIALNRLSFNIHLIIHMGSLKVVRDKAGKVEHILAQSDESKPFVKEAAIYIEIDRQSDEAVLKELGSVLRKVLMDVNIIVQDWPLMKEKAIELIALLKDAPLSIDQAEVEETRAFLQWMVDDHFTFLGYQECHIGDIETPQAHCETMKGSALGVAKFEDYQHSRRLLSSFPQEVMDAVHSKQLLILGKTDVRSTVHRPAYTDFISVKCFDEKGLVVGEKRFIGLYTAFAYNSSPKQIPYLRRKVDQVLSLAGFIPRSHDDRALLNILETLPRDDLFQGTNEEILQLATGILHLQERQRIRLFIRKEIFGNFISCLVFVPKDKFNSDLVDKMKGILLEGLKGSEIEFATRFSDSSLARINFMVRVDNKNPMHYNERELEQKLIESGRDWLDDLKDALKEHLGEERANELLRRYQHGFPAGYKETFDARTAVIDIEYFEKLSKDNSLAMSLYRPLEEADDIIRFKLFRSDATIPLSDVVPILENMDLRIISERPYEINGKNGTGSIWINDYRMVYKTGENFNIDNVREIFQDAFAAIWNGESENDGFNRLVLSAKLTWREIMVIRAYAKYLWQAGFTFSQGHIEETFSANPEIAALLIKLFNFRFNPAEYLEYTSESEQLVQKQQIEKLLENVSSLNEDRILRRFMEVILATVRTNYYQQLKASLSFKLESSKVPELPLPVPLYEIFVYSPHVEGIHLRMAKVARGGIRFSDRREDFRTEILGLMKTQQVKNALIVPMGAKGGFVVKKMPIDNNRDQMMAEVIDCYKTFINGLLDITDNYEGKTIVHPKNLVCYDDFDPYLVVAADKGTATFSDIANSLSKAHAFWLSDAFASGGETGYDHKKMGITARGAFESVKRHFHELNLDINAPFTVAGIGDMSGDVFGNGLLLSKQIKLVAAFNHEFIFLDPNPDPSTSFLERERLFQLPRSRWIDYNQHLISKGGGIYARSLKLIELSTEAQQALGFYQSKVIPSELIKAILKAPVDLLWNGGIGTYVKASFELNNLVGDRTNDVLRVNGQDLRARVVAEGGNLGFTQYGRIEYAKLGGRINTDAIDNSGGVNCSDNEVNIKILLNHVIDVGDLTEKQRNEMLAEVQDEVAELVLKNNQLQTKAISITLSQAENNLEMHGRLIKEMEKSGQLDRALECLPDKEEILKRKALKEGLTRPEIAVLMAYAKIILKESLLSSKLPEEPYFQKLVALSFPLPIQARFQTYMSSHRLKRELIATQLSNRVVNEMGINFINRLVDETGSDPASIIIAYTIASEVFKAGDTSRLIDSLSEVNAEIQLTMLHEFNRLIRRGTRWFLKNRLQHKTTSKTDEIIDQFSPKITELSHFLPTLLIREEKHDFKSVEGFVQKLKDEKVPEELAYYVGFSNTLFSALDIIEASTLHQLPLDKVAIIYYALGARLKLDWFRELIKNRPPNNHWEALARATFRDDLDKQQRSLTVNIMHHNGGVFNDPEQLIDEWFAKHRLLVSRWEYFLAELQSSPEVDFTMFAVSLRELLDLAQLSIRTKVKQ